MQKYKKTVKAHLGPGSSTHFSPAKQHYKEGSKHPTAVGGMMIIKSARIAQIATFTEDPSKCGTMARLTIALGEADVQIIPIYLPVATNRNNEQDENSGQLYQKVMQYVNKERLTQTTPEEWILDEIEHCISKHHEARQTVTIVGGDMNSGWTTQDNEGSNTANIEEWAQTNRLTSPYDALQTKRTTTRERHGHNSIIDHTMFRGTNITPLRVLTDTGQGWGTSDHFPILTTYRIQGWARPYTKRKDRKAVAEPPAPDIKRLTKEGRQKNTKTDKQHNKYQELMEKAFRVEEYENWDDMIREIENQTRTQTLRYLTKINKE